MNNNNNMIKLIKRASFCTWTWSLFPTERQAMTSNPFALVSEDINATEGKAYFPRKHQASIKRSSKFVH